MKISQYGVVLSVATQTTGLSHDYPATQHTWENIDQRAAFSIALKIHGETACKWITYWNSTAFTEKTWQIYVYNRNLEALWGRSIVLNCPPPSWNRLQELIAICRGNPCPPKGRNNETK